MPWCHRLGLLAEKTVLREARENDVPDGLFTLNIRLRNGRQVGLRRHGEIAFIVFATDSSRRIRSVKRDFQKFG